MITNSFKYAKSENKKLKIEIKLKKVNNTIEIEIRDNGKGLPEKILKSEQSLGMELIKSLSEQINGIYSFKNDTR